MGIPRKEGLLIVKAETDISTRIVNIWKYRELLWSLVHKEITVKYKDSFLGFAWSMLNPAAYILIYYVVFGLIFKNGIPLFAIYLFTGLIVWNFFSTAILGSTGVVIANQGLVKKVSFPREILAIAAVGSSFVFFLFQACVLVLFLAVFRILPAFSYLWIIPFALFGLALVACAIAIFLSAATVYLRDLQHLTELVMLAWFWATPVVYTASRIVGSTLALRHHILIYLYLINPVTPVVLLFQRALYARLHPLGLNGVPVSGVLVTYPPSWFFLASLVEILLGVVLMLLALKAFSKLEGNFAEEL